MNRGYSATVSFRPTVPIICNNDWPCNLKWSHREPNTSRITSCQDFHTKAFTTKACSVTVPGMNKSETWEQYKSKNKSIEYVIHGRISDIHYNQLTRFQYDLYLRKEANESNSLFLWVNNTVKIKVNIIGVNSHTYKFNH